MDMDLDPLEPVFRRFVHRFPQAKVRVEFREYAWEDSEKLHAVWHYVGWPSVEMYAFDERIGGPPSLFLGC